jgi:hypothetical protein
MFDGDDCEDLVIAIDWKWKEFDVVDGGSIDLAKLEKARNETVAGRTYSLSMPRASCN